jgi:hypothetical protein
MVRGIGVDPRHDWLFVEMSALSQSTVSVSSRLRRQSGLHLAAAVTELSSPSAVLVLGRCWGVGRAGRRPRERLVTIPTFPSGSTSFH